MLRQAILKANESIASFSQIGAICISFSFHAYLLLLIFSFRFSSIYLTLNTIILLAGIYFIYEYRQQVKQEDLRLGKRYTPLHLVK